MVLHNTCHFNWIVLSKIADFENNMVTLVKMVQRQSLKKRFQDRVGLSIFQVKSPPGVKFLNCHWLLEKCHSSTVI